MGRRAAGCHIPSRVDFRTASGVGLTLLPPRLCAPYMYSMHMRRHGHGCRHGRAHVHEHVHAYAMHVSMSMSMPMPMSMSATAAACVRHGHGHGRGHGHGGEPLLPPRLCAPWSVHMCMSKSSSPPSPSHRHCIAMQPLPLLASVYSLPPCLHDASKRRSLSSLSTGGVLGVLVHDPALVPCYYP